MINTCVLFSCGFIFVKLIILFSSYSLLLEWFVFGTHFVYLDTLCIFLILNYQLILKLKVSIIISMKLILKLLILFQKIWIDSLCYDSETI